MQVDRCTQVRRFAEDDRCTQFDTVAQVGAFAGVQRREVLTKPRKVVHAEELAGASGSQMHTGLQMHRLADSQVLHMLAKPHRSGHSQQLADARHYQMHTG